MASWPLLAPLQPTVSSHLLAAHALRSPRPRRSRVAEVRAAAVSQAGAVLAQLLREEPQPLASDSPTAAFLGTVCGMATAPSCHKRANFVQICAPARSERVASWRRCHRRDGRHSTP